LDKGLDEAQANGWTVVDMKKDWKVIYPPAKSDVHASSVAQPENKRLQRTLRIPEQKN
jgi:hypothetical protein